MPTVRNTITLKDQMSPVLRMVVKSLQSTVTAIASIDNQSNKAFEAARDDIQRASNALDMLEQNMNDVAADTPAVGRALNTNVTNPLMRVSATIYAIQTALGLITKVTTISDTLMLTTSRLNLMNDGLQTTAELQDMIFQSSERARGSYQAQAAAVSKLGILAGEAFKNNEEIVAFTELMQKAFVVGGAGAQEQASAMYQLTQAMAAGKLQGDEFRSIMENAPLLAAAIAKFTGKSKGELKEMSSQGTITADIIKGAMFAAAEEINTKFSSMPMTTAQAFQSIQNQALIAFQPLFVKIGELLNSDRFTSAAKAIVGVIQQMASIALAAFNAMVVGIDFVAKNWKFLAPVILAITALVIAYNAAAIITNTILAIQRFAALASAAATMIQAGATFTATVAQVGLNAALWAFPGTWIVAAIVAIVAGLAMLIIWLLDLWKTNIDFRAGVIRIWNGLLNFFDQIPIFFQWVGNGMADGIGAARVWIAQILQDMVNDTIKNVNKIIDTLNKLPWVNIKKVQSAYFADEIKAAEAAAKAARDAALEQKRQSAAATAAQREEDLNKYVAIEKAKIAAAKQEADAKKQLDAKKTDGIDWEKFTVDGGSLDSVGKIKDDVNISDEDLKYLKDIAAVEFVNRYTTLTPNINVSFGDVRETADVDQIIDRIETILGDVYNSSLVGG